MGRLSLKAMKDGRSVQNHAIGQQEGDWQCPKCGPPKSHEQDQEAWDGVY